MTVLATWLIAAWLLSKAEKQPWETLRPRNPELSAMKRPSERDSCISKEGGFLLTALVERMF